MSVSHAFIRRAAAFVALAATASHSWALCPGCPPIYVAPIEWEIEASVTPLAGGLYDYHYDVRPVSPDFAHLLRKVVIPVANPAAISDLTINPYFDAVSSHRFTAPGGAPVSSGSALLEISTTPGYYAQDYYYIQEEARNGTLMSPYIDDPLKGLSFGFTSSDAPGTVNYRIGLTSASFSHNGVYYGQGHVVTGSTLSPVPEPAALALALCGVALIMLRRKR